MMGDRQVMIAPEVSCSRFEYNPMFGGPEVLGRFMDALRKTGLPD